MDRRKLIAALAGTMLAAACAGSSPTEPARDAKVQYQPTEPMFAKAPTPAPNN